jgi:hypothetical protein
MKKWHTTLALCGFVALVGTLAAQSNSAPVSVGRSVCVPYDPATLKIEAFGSSGAWRLLRGDGAIFRMFDNREDAEAGLAVAKAHTQLCYIGKSNTRPDRVNYVMEYWK